MQQARYLCRAGCIDRFIIRSKLKFACVFFHPMSVRKKEERRAGRLGLVVRVGGQLEVLQLHAVGERHLGRLRGPPGGLPDGQDLAVRLRLPGATGAAGVTLSHGARTARLPRPLHPRRPLQGPIRQHQSAEGGRFQRALSSN